MAKRYWGFNTLAGARRTAAAVAEVTTAGKFDSGFVTNAIQCNQGADYIQIIGPFLDGSSSISGFLSSRMDWLTNSSPGAGNILWLAKNGANNAYRLYCPTGGSLQFSYWNSGTSAWVDWGPSFAVNTLTLYSLTINLTINSAISIWLGTVNVVNNTTPPTNGAAAITEVRLSGVNAASFFSQIMAADYDIRDSHYDCKLPSAEGTYGTDGTGAYTDVNEVILDDSTAIQLPTSGQHRTFLKTAIPALPAGMQISGMVINARGRVGGSVTDGKALCKQGGTDSLSAGLAFGAGYEPRSAFFATDPGTSTAWTKAGFDTAEPGFQAV